MAYATTTSFQPVAATLTRVPTHFHPTLGADRLLAPVVVLYGRAVRATGIVAHVAK